MGSKGIVIFGILLAMFLLISSEVAARQLAETSNTIDTSNVARGFPFCNKNVYGNCIGHDPKPFTRRRCNKKNLCKRPGAPPTKDASTETIAGGQKTGAQVQAKPHN